MKEAYIGLAGVIIGAVITALFTWFLDKLRSDREQKIYFTRKREETYLRVIDCLISFGTDKNWLLSGDPCNEVKKKINSTIPHLKLYASEKNNERLPRFAKRIAKCS